MNTHHLTFLSYCLSPNSRMSPASLANGADDIPAVGEFRQVKYGLMRRFTVK